MFRRFRVLGRVLSPVVIVAFAAQLVAAESPRTDNPRGDRAGAADDSQQYVRELSELTSPTGAVVAVSELREKGKSKRDGVRVAVDDDVVSEKIDIDSSRSEIRAFGLTFHIDRDASGTPQLTISGNGDAASVNGQDHAAQARLNRFFHATNGPARAQHVLEVLRSVGNRVSAASVGAQDAFGCIMDLVALTADWVGVVIACGAPVVNLFACGFAIIWAVADTINIASNIGNDC